MELKYKELTEKIIACAFRVFNELGYGFLESVYEKSLMIELRLAGIESSNQFPLTVRYRDEIVGDYVADIVVESKVIIELKSVSKINKAHEVQLVNYLSATGIDVGLLINFGEKGVEVKRKVRKILR